MDITLDRGEKVYARDEKEIEYAQRFSGIIERAHVKAKRHVKVLVNEDEKPPLDAMEGHRERTHVRWLPLFGRAILQPLQLAWFFSC